MLLLAWQQIACVLCESSGMSAVADRLQEAARAAARAHGTPVTVETFNAWRKKFEAEMALHKSHLGDGKPDVRAGRLTGKQLFMQQIAAGQEVSGSEEEEADGESEVGAGLEPCMCCCWLVASFTAF